MCGAKADSCTDLDSKGSLKTPSDDATHGSATSSNGMPHRRRRSRNGCLSCRKRRIKVGTGILFVLTFANFCRSVTKPNRFADVRGSQERVRPFWSFPNDHTDCLKSKRDCVFPKQSREAGYVHLRVRARKSNGARGEDRVVDNVNSKAFAYDLGHRDKGKPKSSAQAITEATARM